MRSEHFGRIRDDDRIDPADRSRALRWRITLVWFMRLMAIAWCAKGVWWWADILGIVDSVPFEARRAAAKAVAVGFAVVDLVATVGLWLATIWGGLIWLLSITTALILSIATPSLMQLGPAGIAANVGLVAVYLALTAMAAREEDRA